MKKNCGIEVMKIIIHFSIGGAHIIREENAPRLSQGRKLASPMKENGLLANVMIGFLLSVVLIKVSIEILEKSQKNFY